MRNISFFLTTPQFLDGSKDVTRRIGWKDLKPGTVLRACRKCQGIKKGESVEPLGLIRVLSVRSEPLDAIDQADVIREGFPDMTPAEFVAMFCQHMGCEPSQAVNRIEFERYSILTAKGKP